MTIKAMKAPALRSRKRVNWDLFLLALPGLALLFAFYYAPLFGLVIPFKQIDYAKGILGSDWAGFRNFEFFFKSQDFFRVTRNTLGLNFLFIILSQAVSLLLALILFELSRKQVKVYQTAMFIPYFISWVVASYVLYALLNPVSGLFPHFLKTLGREISNIYTTPGYWPFILSASYIWKSCGYTTLIYYAALMGMDPTYFEAAIVDGANKPQITFNISIPFLGPLIILLTILKIGNIFYSDFGMFYFLTRDSGLLYSVTDVIDTYVYRALRVTGDIGMSSAVGFYQSIVGFLLVLGTNLVVRRINRESAIF